jgi:hypothetical protein
LGLPVLGWQDAAGKRNQVFKSGFETKGAAQSALRDAITEHEMKRGRTTQQVNLLGRRTWGFVLGESVGTMEASRAGRWQNRPERPKSKGGKLVARGCCIASGLISWF